MTCYAVIDTNVLVSALLSPHSDAATVQVLDRLFSESFVPVYNEAILEEYENVLHREKFGFTGKKINLLLDVILRIGVKADATPTGEILPGMKDLPFYEVAMEKQAEDAWLVTGNTRHFPEKPFVVTPREFLNIMDD